MKYNFCTLFDSNYLTRGLSLYKSLKEQSIDFHLYVFAFDDECYSKLKKEDIINLTVISLKEFEDADMLAIKNHRTKAEYCWTSTPCTILYCITNFKLNNCTYLDADMYFFNSPSILFEEIGNASIALTKHNYSLNYDQSKTSGTYCVQFVYFKNDITGLKALKWWRDRCIEWCYARLENGKFGDQKYLDDWTERFDNVHVINNPGAGVAPWNVQQFIFDIRRTFKEKGNESKLEYKTIFYHYHNLSFKLKDSLVIVKPSKFELSQNVINLFYIPYIKTLIDVNKINLENFDFLFEKHPLFIRYINSLRLHLKKIDIFRKINAALIKSSR